jgi:hypothetical protein
VEGLCAKLLSLIEIGDCSDQKHLTCLIRVKKSEKYKVKVNYGNKEDTEFLIGG